MENYNNFEEAFEKKPEENYVKFWGIAVGRYYWCGLTKFQMSKAMDFRWRTKESDFEGLKHELEENGEFCVVFPDTVVSDSGVRYDSFIVAHGKDEKYNGMYNRTWSCVPADINHMKMYKDKKYDYVNTLKAKLEDYEKRKNIVRNLEDYSVEISYGKNMDVSKCDDKEKQNIDFYINKVIETVLKEPNTPKGTSEICFQEYNGEIALVRDLIREGKMQKDVIGEDTYYFYRTTDDMKEAQACILTDDLPMYFVGVSNVKGKYIVICVRRNEHSKTEKKKISLHVMYGEKYN